MKKTVLESFEKFSRQPFLQNTSAKLLVYANGIYIKQVPEAATRGVL